MSTANVKRQVEGIYDSLGELLDMGTAGLKADVIAESTSAAGVTIDGVLLKDSAVRGSITAATGKTVNTTDADGVRAAGVILPQAIEISVPILPHATLTEQNLFVATRAYQVTAIRVVPDLVQGGALTGTVCKVASTAAPAKTTTPMHTADQANFNATANTVQTMTLTATTADLQLAAGDRIGLDLSAALTTGRAVITITMKCI